MFLYRKFHLSVQFRGTNLKKQTLGQQQLNTTHVAVTVPLFSELFLFFFTLDSSRLYLRMAQKLALLQANPKYFKVQDKCQADTSQIPIHLHFCTCEAGEGKLCQFAPRREG